MLKVLAYLIPVLLFSIGIRRPKSRFITLWFCIYFFILMGLNLTSPDYVSYKSYYENLGENSYELESGFVALMTLCKVLDFSYQQFRMFFTIIYVILVIITTKRLTPYINYVLAVFMVMPFTLNVSGIRFSMAAIIVCLGITFICSDKRKGIMKFLICVLIATLIHRAAALCLIFILSKVKFKRIHYVLIGTFVVGGLVVIRSNILLIIAQKLFPTSPLIWQWLDLNGNEIGHLNITGFVLNVIFVVAFPIWIHYITRLIFTSKNGQELNQNNKNADDLEKIRIYSNIGDLGMLFIPAYSISSEYQRYLFAMLLIFYPIFAKFRYEIKLGNRTEKIFCNAFSIILPLLLLALYMYSMTSHDVMATFVDNLVFQGTK